MAPRPSGPGGLSLSSIASGAHNETRKRVRGSNAQTLAAGATRLQDKEGGLRGQEEALARQNAHEAQQQALDIALARREQAQREAQAAASRRYSQLSAARERDAMIREKQEENATWFDQQRFQTDENLRQAEGIAALEAKYARPEEEEDDGMPRFSDFGGATINPYRGRALGDFKDNAGIDVTSKELGKTQEIINKHGDDPNAVIHELRKQYGNRTRTASLALWELGYLPQG